MSQRYFRIFPIVLLVFQQANCYQNRKYCYTLICMLVFHAKREKKPKMRKLVTFSIKSKQYLIYIIALILHTLSFAYISVLLNDLCPNNPLKKAFNKLMDNKPEIRLNENENSAALIHQTWNSSSFKRFDECSFNVDVTKEARKTRNSGLYLSIKRLNLRKSGYDDECIDYIRFKFGDKKTQKICGQVDVTSPDVEKYHFDVAGGLTKIYISIDKLRPLHRTEDTLDVELVFTAYQSKFATYSVTID